MLEKLRMRLSFKFPLLVLIIGFIFVFILAVQWLQSIGLGQESGHFASKESLLSLNDKEIHEVMLLYLIT